MSDEAKLVAAAQAGEQDAFTALYEAHAGSVRAVGRKILRTDDVDDFCQETFLLAFTRIHRFDGKSQFRTWITRIAINRALMTLRKQRTPRMVGLDDPLLEDWMVRRRDATLEGVPARLDAQKILGCLKPPLRQMVEMAYLEECTDAEIVERLGISHTALRSRLYQIKHRFRGGPASK